MKWNHSSSHKFRRRHACGIAVVGAAVFALVVVLIVHKGHANSQQQPVVGVPVVVPPLKSSAEDVIIRDDGSAAQKVELVATTQPPELSHQSQSKPLAILHTDHGDITWELLPDDAPVTVANFARMSREGVFNQSCFYRYERGFVLQGGLHCNKPPPHHGKAKNVPLEYKRRNEKYTVALARAGGDLNSGGTEFFINLRDNANTLGPGKKGGYAVFAVVVDGMETIAAMKKLPTKTAGLTRFVSPQPMILFIEIRNYDAPMTSIPAVESQGKRKGKQSPL